MNRERENARDLQLLTLLIDRELERGDCDVDLLQEAVTRLLPDEHRTDRMTYELQFDVLKDLRATVTDTWWINRDRDVAHLCRQAKDIAASVEALWQNRDETKVLQEEVVSEVRRDTAKARRRGMSCRFISAEIGPVQAGNTVLPSIHVTIERLGPSLLPETTTLIVDDEDEVSAELARMTTSQKDRQAQQLRLQGLGADGEIDAVALRFLQMEGCDVPAILARLPHAEGWTLNVELPGEGDRKVVLFWEDGVVHARVPLAEGVRWSRGKVSFSTTPTKFPARPTGRLLSDFVKSQALSDDVRILSGHRGETSADAYVPFATILFDSRTGITRAS